MHSAIRPLIFGLSFLHSSAFRSGATHYELGSGRSNPFKSGAAKFRTDVSFRFAASLKEAPSAHEVMIVKMADVAICQLPVSGEVISSAIEKLKPQFEKYDQLAKRNLKKVLDSFRKHKVDNSMFAGVDGYGHGDIGRDTLDSIYAELFQAESALIRAQCFSGTHAIACSLFGVLRPGDTLLACSGTPYDTLEEVIGKRKPRYDDGSSLDEGLVGSLLEFDIKYREVPLLDDGNFDFEAIDKVLNDDLSIKVLHIQRSCGYQWRSSIPIGEIKRFCDHIRKKWVERTELVIFVDNCYGEFVEDKEPTAIGADIVAGSLIKNPGGTIAKSGGYIAGKKKYVRAASNRMSAPGVEGGATLSQNRNLYQGLFLSCGIISESLKGASLVQEVFGNNFNFPTNPTLGTERTDIIQSVAFGSRDKLIKFCQVVQRYSPIGSHYIPVPGITSGYGDEVIFADGTFIDGSTLELSADGPLREPFAAYIQGCTHWTHWAIILEEAIVEMGLARSN